MNSLKDLKVEGLQDLYDAEQQITAALPQMEQAAGGGRLYPPLR